MRGIKCDSVYFKKRTYKGGDSSKKETSPRGVAALSTQ